MNKLLAGATDHQAGSATGASPTHHNEIGHPFTCRPHQSVNRFTVNHQSAMGDPRVHKRTTPLPLQQGRHLASVASRGDDRRAPKVGKQSQDMDGDDLATRGFHATVLHERDGPIQGAPRVF
jgi:hypothetical protein